MSDNEVVYVIQSELGGPVKIGRTRGLEQRLANIQGAFPFGRLRLIATRPGGSALETFAHQTLSPWRMAQGEWFMPAFEFVKRAVKVFDLTVKERQAIYLWYGDVLHLNPHRARDYAMRMLSEVSLEGVEFGLTVQNFHAISTAPDALYATSESE